MKEIKEGKISKKRIFCKKCKRNIRMKHECIIKMREICVECDKCKEQISVKGIKKHIEVCNGQKRKRRLNGELVSRLGTCEICRNDYKDIRSHIRRNNCWEGKEKRKISEKSCKYCNEKIIIQKIKVHQEKCKIWKETSEIIKKWKYCKDCKRSVRINHECTIKIE